MLSKLFVGLFRIFALLLHLAFNLIKLWILIIAFVLAVFYAAGLLTAEGDFIAQEGAAGISTVMIVLGSPIVAMIGYYVLSLRRLRRREMKFSPVGFFTRRAAIHSSMLFMIMPIISSIFFLSFEQGLAPRIDGTKIDFGEEIFLFTLENIAKVLLFDFLEVYDIAISNIVATSTEAKTFVFVYRLLISVTIAKYLSTILNFKEYPIGSRRAAET